MTIVFRRRLLLQTLCKREEAEEAREATRKAREAEEKARKEPAELYFFLNEHFMLQRDYSTPNEATPNVWKKSISLTWVRNLSLDTDRTEMVKVFDDIRISIVKHIQQDLLEGTL